MKIENLSDLILIIMVFIPGFIYNGIIEQFVPPHQNRSKEGFILRLITSTSFIYALCSPLIYVLVFSKILDQNFILKSILCFVIVFIFPVILAIVRARQIQAYGFSLFPKFLRLRPINPIPTGWDWIFGRTEPCFLLITLTDGTEIAGYFGRQSMASSDPERKDIFIEKVYKIPEDGSTWTEVAGSLGMQVAGEQISHIEFRR